jgi:hypothetical protein
MVTKIFPNLDASFTSLLQFSSRWEVDEFMRRSAFSVFVSVREYNWLLLAPFQICQIIQRWASESSDATDALIRYYPTLSDAHRQIVESLATEHRLVFLSPPDVVSEEINTKCLADLGIQWPTIHSDLQQGVSEGCFAPVSMLVVAPPFTENRTGVTREFDALFTDFGNSPVKLRRCQGRRVLEEFTPQGYTLVIPFHEYDKQYKDTLAFELMQAMPYYCWPSPVLSSRQVLELMEPAFADRPHRVLRPSDDGGQA